MHGDAGRRRTHLSLQAQLLHLSRELAYPARFGGVQPTELGQLALSMAQLLSQFHPFDGPLLSTPLVARRTAATAATVATAATAAAAAATAAASTATPAVVVATARHRSHHHSVATAAARRGVHCRIQLRRRHTTCICERKV